MLFSFYASGLNLPVSHAEWSISCLCIMQVHGRPEALGILEGHIGVPEHVMWPRQGAIQFSGKHFLLNNNVRHNFPSYTMSMDKYIFWYIQQMSMWTWNQRGRSGGAGNRALDRSQWSSKWFKCLAQGHVRLGGHWQRPSGYRGPYLPGRLSEYNSSITTGIFNYSFLWDVNDHRDKIPFLLTILKNTVFLLDSASTDLISHLLYT